MRFKAHKVSSKDIVASFDGTFFEDVDEASISEEKRTIKNVCVFGTRYSKNGYTYQDKAIASLTDKTEGAKFFVNHPSHSEDKDRDGVRDMRDWAGIYRNPVMKGDKVFADLVVREAYWPLVKDVATMKPFGVGNSINSRVKVYKDEQGAEHVVDLDVLKSIDLVASAATTQNLFESTMKEVDEGIDDSLEAISKEEDLNERIILIQEFVAKQTEGLLADKIKERNIARAISRLNYQVGDVIDQILRDKDKGLSDKKKDVSSVMDDYEKEVNNLLSGKTKPKTNDDLMFSTKNTDDNTEEDEMDLKELFKGLTLESLSKERPDLLEELKNGLEDAERIGKMEDELGTIKKAHEELRGQFDTLTKAHEELKKENEGLKKELDEYKAKDKKAAKEAFIAEAIKEAKLPEDAITDFWKESLMKKDEEEIKQDIEDRKGLWEGKVKKVVTESGDEYKMVNDDKTDTFDKEKKESAMSKIREAVGRKSKK